ncbi:MAG: 30S ribosomal protein S17 [Candidatus Aenigmatarchaeota archaeon]
MKEKKQKNIGLDAKKPDTVCNSIKCPWHGTLKIRGRIFKGRVVKSKATDTVIVEWDFYRYIPKYERYERRKTHIAAHNPKCISAVVGDVVRIGECRPLSKSKRFVVFEKLGENK